MRYQLRIYTTKPGELARFVEEWRAQVVPLRRRFGFEVVTAWASEEDDTFVWVVGYDGDDWKAAERAYYESPERRGMEPDPARLLAEPRAVWARPAELP